MLPLPPQALPALVVVDMQEYFFRTPERRINLERVLVNINLLSAAFGRQGFPVVHVISAYSADGIDWDLKMKASGVPELIAGSPEAQILEGLTVKKNHLMVVKTRYSAFFKTNLAETLRSRGVQLVAVCGAYTHYCVNATVFDAYCHDFVPGLIEDAVMSHLPEESQVMVARMRRNGYHVMTTAEALVRWGGA